MCFINESKHTAMKRNIQFTFEELVRGRRVPVVILSDMERNAS